MKIKTPNNIDNWNYCPICKTKVNLILNELRTKLRNANIFDLVCENNCLKKHDCFKIHNFESFPISLIIVNNKLTRIEIFYSNYHTSDFFADRSDFFFLYSLISNDLLSVFNFNLKEVARKKVNVELKNIDNCFEYFVKTYNLFNTFI